MEMMEVQVAEQVVVVVDEEKEEEAKSILYGCSSQTLEQHEEKWL